MLKFLERILGSKRQKDVEALLPIVEEINHFFEAYQSLSDDELRGKTTEFRARIQEKIAADEEAITALRERLKEITSAADRDDIYDDLARLENAVYAATQEVLAEILPEAFAVVKEACRRHVGKTWEAGGSIITWDMVHYDVQLVGGIVLHEGKIAEMATGEGKTLVATLPVYLNALPAKGVHIITVNDYLARRDAEWMGPIYEWLGLTVGCIQSSMLPQQRAPHYGCDITFGTNNEFGFDYLRDNMSQSVSELVQRGHNYAIVDEVDSVLIDEARTPLIISGPVGTDNDQSFNLMKPRVDRIVRLQMQEATAMVAEAERLLAADDPKTRAEAGVHLLRAWRGVPKHNRLTKLLQDAGTKKLLQDTELEYLRDKGARMQEIDKDLYYSIDEKNHSIDLSDKGRQSVASSGEDPDIFLLPDLAAQLSEIEGSSLSPEEKVLQSDKATQIYAERSDRIHTIAQLLKAYSLYEKDVEYVVDGGKIKIVDTFTGRILEGRRYSDGLHQAIEAKEGVTVEQDTQTFATVTIQNYFRLYRKLSGMTGTAETEETEFNQIYKLDVVVIPTNRPIVRNDMNDLIYRTKRAKYNAVIAEIEQLREIGRPVLVGTTSVEVSETLSRMLQRAKIQHSVLNAKQHAREAEIVAGAGQKSAVTIATNMAGRGTDIKLGPGVKDYGGLAIIGTERHESRRIDRQLRGRAGRQGDPGSSKFFISMEDDLMRLFGGDTLTRYMDRLKVGPDEVLEHSLLTKSVERAQKKVEENNFSIRKRLLEYDDVMNQQREVVYDRRRHALHGERLKSEVLDNAASFVSNLVDACFPDAIGTIVADVQTKLVTPIQLSEERANELGPEALKDRIMEAVRDVYDRKESRYGSEFMANLERYAVLGIIDDKWRQHLRDMDDLKQGISLRAYAQRDPLVEYKREAFNLFTQMLDEINTDVASFVLRYNPEPAMVRQQEERARQQRSAEGESRASGGALPERSRTTSSRRLRFSHATSTGLGLGANPDSAMAASGEQGASSEMDQPVVQVVRDEKKIGRNDPCFCGSGKKYKHCHGRQGDA